MTILKAKQQKIGPILGRHPWIFSGALVSVPDGLESGIPVKITDEKGNFLAQGYFNSYSQIAVRIWGYDEDEKIDADFFEKRIRSAFGLRKELVLDNETDSCRLISSENDFLPGLVVDKYADYLVVQFHTLGIEKWKEEIINGLVKIMDPKGIYERSDAKKGESAEKKTGLLHGEIPDLITIKENGLKFLVSIKEGQKTGFFLDQRDKRQALMKYVKGKKVLNCFSYTGGFSVYALAAGAKSVVSVDVSADSLELAKENVKVNKLDLEKCEFVCEDAKQYLKKINPGDFDLIILDPPAFIKDRKKKKEGISGYRHINETALRVLPEDGVLVTCSCSTHISLQDFRYVVSEAGGRAKRSVQLLETYIHGIDHPELIPFTEGEYLKVFFARIK